MTIAELISQALADGLEHPGDSAAGQPPITIRLPLFRMAGQPQEMYEQVQNTVTMIGEAIVHLINTRGESVIVPRSEFEALKSELAQLKEEA